MYDTEKRIELVKKRMHEYHRRQERRTVCRLSVLCNGLSAQDYKICCRILPGTGDHLCRYRGYPEHPERKRPGTQDKPEVSQPAV